MNVLTTGRRLRLVWLLLGMMFFYGIEQLFLNKVIKDHSARAYLTIGYALALVAFDVPAGILADKVSRKLCLLLGCLVQIVALLVLGTSHGIAQYIVGSAIFGLAICLVDGAAQAILYDWLAVTHETKRYGKEQGRNYAAFLVGAGIANLASGFIANALNLKSTFFISIVPAAVAFLLLLGLKDPPFAKKQATVWYVHLRDVIRELTKHQKIIAFALQSIAATVALYTIGEFGQIYMLSFGISTVALGIFWAIDAVFAAGGRALAHRIQSYPRLLIIVFCIVVSVFALIHQSIGIGVFWLLYGLNEAISNVAETEIQNETSSHVRATTLSMVNFIGNLLAVPVILAYNHYYLRHGIFKANQLIVVAVVIVLIATLFARPKKIVENALS
jgi:MFS family permease